MKRVNGLIYPGLFLTVWSLPFTAWWSAETVSGFATRKGTHSFPFLQMYLELKLSIGKVRAKKATTENANYHLFWQVGVKKNKLRVVETSIEILQKDFSLHVCVSKWLSFSSSFCPAFLLAFHSETLLSMETSYILYQLWTYPLLTLDKKRVVCKVKLHTSSLL